MAGWNQNPWNITPWSPFSPAPAPQPTNGQNLIVPGAQSTTLGDNFNSLSNRLLGRCPSIGIMLAYQFINDAWRTLQAQREWSFRRRSGVFAPPSLYTVGTASTNVAAGSAMLITGTGTNWVPTMIGQQIRLGGLLYPFYTITGVLSSTALTIDQPWYGGDVVNQPYTIQQIYYPVPYDFGYMYVAVSIKDSYRLWTNLTQADLALMDPQRTNFGQTYAAVFRDYSPIYGGVIGPVIPVTNQLDPRPVSTTSTGYTYPVDSTYVIQVVQGGPSGAATFQWMRAGQTGFQPAQITSDQAQDLSDGVQVYWPDGFNYIAGDIYVINCKSMVASSVPRYELWPGPTYSGYLYPYIYIAKEYDLTVETPWLPPFMSNRGEVILEMGLQKCAEFPGQDSAHPNIYHDLRQAVYHAAKVKEMLIDLTRNDEEVGVSNIDYEMYPFAPAPWLDSGWQQTHAPFLFG